MQIVLLFPGQGSQKPGMGKDLASRFPEAAEVFEAADATLRAPLSSLMFDGPAEELTLTHNAQPALLVHGMALWSAVRERLVPRVVAAAGHSLGEFTAYCAAGSMSFQSAVALVRRRGQLMFDTGVQRPGAMAAILGTLREPVESLCERATSEAGLVVPANYNGDEQTVVSGEVAGVERLMELAKEAGAKRAMRLQVSGAFHSPLMDSAREGLAVAIEQAGIGDPTFAVYSNVTAQPVVAARDARDLLLRQLTSPVRWTALVRNLAAAHPGALFVELGPGNVLTGLAKRIAPNVATMACGNAVELESLLERAA